MKKILFVIVFFADNTRLVSEFHHEESELEYEECELLDLSDHDKNLFEQLASMLSDRAELINFGTHSEFMFSLYDLEECIKEVIASNDN